MESIKVHSRDNIPSIATAFAAIKLQGSVVKLKTYNINMKN